MQYPRSYFHHENSIKILALKHPNVNFVDFDLGHLQQSHDRVDSVELPKWAAGPEDFINKHMKALVSWCNLKQLNLCYDNPFVL